METLWGRSPKDPAAFGKTLAGTPDFLAAGQRLGLQAQTVQITPSALRGAKYPMILFLQEEPDVVVTAGSLVGRREKGEPRYVVFEKVHGNDAVILDPRVGHIAVPVSDLVESVAGTGTVWMPNP
jgi:ABC-type bacteriocin/lantibiotic exporter with double-glycine peptidase domain